MQNIPCGAVLKLGGIAAFTGDPLDQDLHGGAGGLRVHPIDPDIPPDGSGQVTRDDAKPSLVRRLTRAVAAGLYP